MSKIRLNKFLSELSKAELREQVQDLYQRFKNVKEFYDFSFNPNEDKIINELKVKISKEYFPTTTRRAKKRRSTAQKAIIHLQQLEVNPEQIADVMFYNLEIAQAYTEDNFINQESFYKSMLNSFKSALKYVSQNGFEFEFSSRIESVIKKAFTQKWINAEGFYIAKKEILSS